MDGLAVLIGIVAFILAIVAISKNSKLETRLAMFKADLEALRAERAVAGPVRQAAESATPMVDEAANQDVAPEPGQPASQNWGVRPEKPAGEEVFAVSAEVPPEAASEQPPAPPQGRDMEQALASRWFVWIGAAAIAIGGLLFVKYAYDNGLISPRLQTVLGLLAGLCLVAAGEWVRRRASAGMEGRDNYVPAALSAAGLATIFASIYASYALYGLVDPTIAFVGLGMTGLGALVLSRLQGPLIAALGLIGSYVTPALIPSDAPNAWSFFAYLLVIMAASYAVLRNRNWWWLGFAATAGAATWAALWLLGGMFKPEDILPIGLFAHVTGAMAFYGLRGRAILAAESGDLANPSGLTQPLLIGLFGLAAESALLLMLVAHASHGTLALVLLSLAAAGLLALAWLKDGISVLAPVGGLLLFVALMAWPEAAFHAATVDEHGVWTWSNAITPETARFLNWMLASGAVLTVAGAAGVLFKARATAWGLLGGAAACVFVGGAWGRADFMFTETSWALVAIAFAAVLLAAVAAAGRREPEAGTPLGAGLLAAGSAGLLVFAADRLFDKVALTLAIAALAFAYAAATLVLKPRLLGPIAVALAALSALRLFVSRELWDDDRTLAWGQHWVLYGYGVPVLLFYGGSRLLRRTGHDKPATALEGISLGLALSLIALEIRVLITGGIIYEEPRFLEMAAHFATWFAAAYGLMHRQRLFSSFIAKWGARVLMVMAVAGTIMASLLGLNPVVTGDVVPGNVVLNALLLAYLVPAIMLALIAARLPAIGWQDLRTPALGLSLALAFVYITMETKRVFQGMIMTIESQSVAESYAYSAVWLAFALILFVAGIRLGKQYVRLAGLGVIAIVVVKVFLLDMSNLEGLYRIVSFVGLGLCLVGIGWLYQRFVQPREAPRS